MEQILCGAGEARSQYGVELAAWSQGRWSWGSVESGKVELGQRGVRTVKSGQYGARAWN